YDWGYTAYEDSRAVRYKADMWQGRIARIPPMPLRNGDLVKVFKTVTDGDVLWQGTISFDTKKYHHGQQRKMNVNLWDAMFYDRMPAKLEADGKVMYGALEPFCETGTEGVVWCLSEYGYESYGALRYLKNGDKLTVYSAVRDGAVEWEGKVAFGPEDKIVKTA